MSRHDALQGSLPLLVLKILDARGPLHGYGLTSQIEGMSNDVLSVEQGSLYPALHRMEEEGWIQAEWVVTKNKRKARIYRITPTGRDYLGKEETRWKAVTAAVSHILRHA